MRHSLHYLNADSMAFPPVHLALTDPNGLLAIGGDLSSQRLISAYQQGIFPWFSDGDPIMWWSPSPRAIIAIDAIKINKTLTKVLKRKHFTVTLNGAFEQVLAKCANAPFRNDDTWIVDQMRSAYTQLHQLGFAHSIEVWQEDELVGGLYGVAINGFFSGESMFYQKSNASKVALVSLAKLLASINIDFIDCQIINPFLKDMGCVEIDRKQFVEIQQTAITKEVPADFWTSKTLTVYE